MFQGGHLYHVDEKGRLKLPAEFAAGLGAPFTLTRGQGRCLWLLPEAEWVRLASRLEGESLFDERRLALARFFIGAAVRCQPDVQGRIPLPPLLREFAGIEHEAVVLGTGPRVEIWSRQRWEEYQARLSDDLIAELARAAGI
jgi:MraZ protein